MILRLALNRDGALLHGELVDVEAVPVDHFVGWRGLIRSLHHWLERRRGVQAALSVLLAETDV